MSGVFQTDPNQEPIRIRLRGEDSDGELALIELVMGAHSAGPPLHVHPTHGEGFYVLNGELTLQLGDKIISGGPGTWAFAPKDTPHALANHTDQDARLLVVCAPAGFEGYFDRIIAEQAGTPPPAGEPKWQTRMVGPPIPPRT